LWLADSSDDPILVRTGDHKGKGGLEVEVVAEVRESGDDLLEQFGG
jgi:hypothetical protein